MDVIKLSRPSGLTLYSFERPQLPFEPQGGDFVFRLLDLVAYRFDDIVIDLPNIETPWQNSVLSTSDEIFIVFEPQRRLAAAGQTALHEDPRAARQFGEHHAGRQQA